MEESMKMALVNSENFERGMINTDTDAVAKDTYQLLV